MACSYFKTLEQIEQDLGIVIRSENKLYIGVKPLELSTWFIETMRIVYVRAIQINTESSRQALIVDNVSQLQNSNKTEFNTRKRRIKKDR